MKRILSWVFLGVLAGSSAARAVVVDDTQVEWAPDPASGYDYRATVHQDPTIEATYVWFNHRVTFFPPSDTLQVVNTVLDEGSSWYLAQEGQEFSPATIAANQFTPLQVVPMLPPGPMVPTPHGTFYFGIQTHVGARFGSPAYVAYGWAKMSYTGTDITMLDNAVAYSTPGEPAGIYIGTSTAVPEPSSLGVVVAGVIGCSRASRFRRRAVARRRD